MGIDIVEIEEIKNSIETSKRFTERVFTPQEIAYCESKANKYASYAARFAAKEAVMKALGTGWDMGVQWKQIEVSHEDERLVTRKGQGINCVTRQQPPTNSHSGIPEIKLTGKSLKLSKKMGVESIFLSLSHSRNSAVASVIFERNLNEVKGIH